MSERSRAPFAPPRQRDSVKGVTPRWNWDKRWEGQWQGTEAETFSS